MKRWLQWLAGLGFTCLGLTTICLSQGESAVPFLLISPCAEANGMGEASVAIRTDDPLASIRNPAHLGMQSLTSYFSAGTNTSDWLPIFNADLRYRTLAINAGLNLGKAFGFSPAMSLGLGYSRVYLDLGEFIRISSAGPEPIDTFHADESSDQWTVGIGLDYWVKLSAGLTFKHIVSNLSPFGTEEEKGSGRASVGAVDYGLLFDLPVMDVISRALQSSIEVYPHVNPILNLSFGFSRNNLGNKVVYIDAAQAGPLPRTARLGVGVDLGVMYKVEGIEWKPFSFKWTVEASDLLVRRLPGGAWTYEDGVGNLDFFKEVILGKTNKETEKRKGWELNILEIISIRGGRFEEDRDRGNRRFNTSGFGVRFAGIPKLLRALGVPFEVEGIGGFIVNHLDVRYNHSEWNPDELDHPLQRTKFNSVNLVVSN